MARPCQEIRVQGDESLDDGRLVDVAAEGVEPVKRGIEFYNARVAPQETEEAQQNDVAVSLVLRESRVLDHAAQSACASRSVAAIRRSAKFINRGLTFTGR